MNRIIVVLLNFFCIFPCFAEDLRLIPSPVPGVYAENITVDAVPGNNQQIFYRFLGSTASDFLPLKEPLKLSVLDGEVRKYTLRLSVRNERGESLTKDFEYILDKKLKAFPEIEPAPGIFDREQTLKARIPSGWSVRLNDSEIAFPFQLSVAPGEKKTFHFVVDPPTSFNQLKRDWVYVVDRQGQESPSLEILSPKPGKWANPQLLALSFRGVDKVLVTWGAESESAKPEEYLLPTLLDRTGKLFVSVSARSKLDGAWIQKTVSWEVVPGGDPSPWPVSAWSDKPLELPSPGEGWEMSRDQGATWDKPVAPLKESLRTASLKVVTYQLRKTPQSVAYRYFYAIDDRTPGSPTIQVFGGFSPSVSINGSSDGRYTIKWGETESTPQKTIWGPVGILTVPDGVRSVSAIETLPNGRQSSASTTSVSFPAATPPVWQGWDLDGKLKEPFGGLVLPVPGLIPVFELGETSDVAEPSENSSEMPSPFLLDGPAGFDHQYFLRLAWKDNSGKVGISSDLITLRVDRLSPQTPVLRIQENKARLEPSTKEDSDAEIYFSITKDPVRENDAIHFEKYAGPLDLPEVESGSQATQWIHFYAQDRTGNLSAFKTNVPLTVDKRPFSLVGYQDLSASINLTDQGVYTRSSILLKPLIQGADAELFYIPMPTNQSSDKWQDQAIPYSEPIKVAVRTGEKRTFFFGWNAKSNGQWMWETPQVFTFTLDMAAPQEPVIENRNPGDFLDGAWQISAKTVNAGDKLFYTLSQDSSTPPDPKGPSGKLWPGTLKLDAQEGGKVVFRVRLVVVSASGTSKELESLGPVTIDRTIPEEPKTNLNATTFSKEALTIQFDSMNGVLHQNITEDGSLPEIPTMDSPVMSNNRLSLEGKENTVKFYRFRVRAFSPTGRGGISSKTYTVIIDRSTNNVAMSKSAETKTNEASVKLNGLPENNLSNHAITLTSASTGILRYEMVEGESSANAVTRFSPLLSSSLVLDCDRGTDRVFHLNVRVFDEDGEILSQQESWDLRVDKRIPSGSEPRITIEKQRSEFSLSPPGGSSEPGVKAYYRWQWVAFPDGQGSIEWTPLNDSVVFSSPEGRMTKIHLEVRNRDAAGNESDAFEKDILLDQNVEYLASGVSSGDGSRSKPFGDFEAAFNAMRNNGKKLLFLSTGNYEISHTFDLTGLSLWGGLNPTAWEATKEFGFSQIHPQSTFTGENLFEAYKGALEVHRVETLTTEGFFAAHWHLEGTQVRMQDSSFQARGGSRAVWSQSGGSLIWSGISGGLNKAKDGRFLELKGVDFRIVGLDLSAQKNNEARLLSFDRSSGTISDLVVVSKMSDGLDSIFQMNDGELTVNNLRILAGEGSGWASGLTLKNCKTNLWNAEITLYGGRGNTGVQVEGGSFEADKANVTIPAGIEFNQGVTLRGGSLKMTKSTIKLDAGTYQSGLSITDGRLSLAVTSIEISGGGRSAWGAQFLGSCFVDLQENVWTLSRETKGSCWTLEKGWLSDSTERENEFKGWTTVIETGK